MGGPPRATSDARTRACCPFYHEAVELIGRRWTGAILRVLMDGPLRFSEIAQSIPELSDRLLSERVKELEARGIVERRVLPGPPVRVEYALSEMGRQLEPALEELQEWARRWLASAPSGRRSREPKPRTEAANPSRDPEPLAETLRAANPSR